MDCENLSITFATGWSLAKAEPIRSNDAAISIIKGLISRHFIRAPKMAERIYADHKVVDIESDIRRSTVETSCYELKQGVLDLTEGATDPRTMLSKIPIHICAIANNGKGVGGKLMIGVCDSQADAERVKALHGVEARHVGSKFIVGVRREADAMGISVERYFQVIRDAIAGSGLSENLRSSVLATIDFNSYYGLGVIVIAVRPQEEMSYLNDDVYYRSGDQTLKAQTAKEVGMVAARFR